MTSSLRNSLHRKNHKERSQLANRTRYGILEKHADYVKRARDYHSKQDRLTRLKQKAAERNKDEFYFSMTHERTQGGVHVKTRGNQALPIDIVKVLKTQDENYVRTMRLAGLKKIDKIKNQLTTLADLVKSVDNLDEMNDEELEILREAGIIKTTAVSGRIKKAKHIIFAVDQDQAREYASERKSKGSDRDLIANIAEQVDLGWKVPEEKSRGKKRQPMPDSKSQEVQEDDIEDQNEPSATHRARLLKELSARLFRDKQMRYAEREFEMQRLLVGKGGRRKVQGVQKIEGVDDDSEEDEDEIDARRGKAKPRSQKAVDEKLWKPRIYKWRHERKR